MGASGVTTRVTIRAVQCRHPAPGRDERVSPPLWALLGEFGTPPWGTWARTGPTRSNFTGLMLLSRLDTVTPFVIPSRFALSPITETVTMKTCPDCGSFFTGFDDRCDVCRRRPTTAKRSSQKTIDDKIAAIIAGVPDEAIPRPSVQAYPDRLGQCPPKPGPGQSCPTCGRIAPMTNSQRQKRHRERTAGKTGC